MFARNILLFIIATCIKTPQTLNPNRFLLPFFKTGSSLKPEPENRLKNKGLRRNNEVTCPGRVAVVHELPVHAGFA